MKNPTGYDPTNYPEPRRRSAATSCSTGWPQLNVITPTREAAASADDSSSARAPPRPRNGCVYSPRAVLLRLRRPATCAATRRSARPREDRERCSTRGGLTIKTTSTCATSRPRDRPSAAQPRRTRPTRPSAALAMVEPGTGEVGRSRSRARWARQGDGRDLPQLRRAQEVRRLQRLPGGLDVQGVRAGRRDRAGHPARTTQINVAADRRPSKDTFKNCDGGTCSSTDDWSPRTPPAPAPSTSTPAPQLSVNTFFCPARGAVTGLCEPRTLATADGRRASATDRDVSRTRRSPSAPTRSTR